MANGLAAWLLEAGCGHQDKVALYLYNGPQYMQAAYACMKVSLVPVNTNYRYRDDELAYLWGNSDAAAVVYHAAFDERIACVRSRCPKVRLWVRVGGQEGAGPGGTVPYELAAAPSATTARAPWGRSATGTRCALPRAEDWGALGRRGRRGGRGC